jgi:5,5'-dehydrodivanillate O-demethylase
VTQNQNAAHPSWVDVNFVKTGPDTLAGRYLRQFWQPVYHSADLVVGKPVPLRIMSQGYTLFRGTSGQAFLLDERCRHRGAQLSTGWVEGDSVRCFYHGWKFKGTGECVEQPAESPGFADKVPMRAYPLREYLGLVFAWLGEGDAPAFPTYPEFDSFEGLLEVDSYSRNCNYFQNLENAMDMSHVGYVHGDNQVAFNGIGAGKNSRAEETDWGVRYSVTRADGQVRVQQFGMPNIFYMLALPNDPEIGWQESLFWWVPIEDDLHMQFSLHRVPVQGEARQRINERRQKRRSEIDLAHQVVCEQILGGMLTLQEVDKSRVDLVRLQDDIAQLAQGRIADHQVERLGSADIGLAVVRRLWRREIASLQSGTEQKNWRRGSALVPTAWGLSGSPAQQFATTTDGPARTLEVVDVRPHVEVRLQLEALHGFTSRNRA